MTQPTLPESATEADADLAPPRRRRRFLLPLGLFLLIVLLLVWVLRPKPVPPPVIRVYTPQQAATAQQHVDALSAQLLYPASVTPAPLSAESSSPAAPQMRHTTLPQPAAVHMQLSEADLNTILATNPQVVRALRAHGIKAIQILLHEPQSIDIRAAVLYKGHPANMEIAGILQASPKTIVCLVTTHAQIGRVPVPSGVVTREAAKLADQFTKRVRGRLPLEVQSVQVIQKNLVLTGIPRAKTQR